MALYVVKVGAVSDILMRLDDDTGLFGRILVRRIKIVVAILAYRMCQIFASIMCLISILVVFYFRSWSLGYLCTM